jgi:hypothetical protein
MFRQAVALKIVVSALSALVCACDRTGRVSAEVTASTAAQRIDAACMRATTGERVAFQRAEYSQ